MGRSLAVTGAMTALLLAGCSSAPALPGGMAMPPHPVPAAPHTASLLADGGSRATLDVLTGTTALTIGVADFGTSGSLLRVSTPAGGPPPQLRVSDADGTARPGEDPLGGLSAEGAAAVTVTLNADVSWQLNLAGGTSRTIAALRGGHVAGISVTAGSDVIDLALPRPLGSMPVTLGAGASQVLLSLPGGVPVRVTAAGGAGEVSLEGQDRTGVAGGSVFTTPGWAPGAPGFYIDAMAGAARIAVTARAS